MPCELCNLLPLQGQVLPQLRIPGALLAAGGPTILGLQLLGRPLVLQLVDLSPQIVDLSDEGHILLHDPHVVDAVALAVFLQLPLQRVHRLLEVVALPLVLRLHVRVQVKLLGAGLHILPVQVGHALLEDLRLGDVFEHVAKVQLEALDESQIIAQPSLLRLDLLLQCALLHLELRDVEGQLFVLPHVVVELVVHRLCLLLHGLDVGSLGVDLSLQLLDLVVEDKLELLQLLILLPQIVDAQLLVCDGLIALLDLFLVRILVLEQGHDHLLLMSVFLLLLFDVVRPLLHLTVEVVVILLVDASLPSKSDLFVLLLREFLLVHLLKLLDLAISILLQLCQGLLVGLEGQLLLLDDAVLRLSVRLLDRLEVAIQMVDL
mmetsp:Transcript_78628/g.200129  ORF Transcript_78628/g.200129 Transcript_78628/m.200129 type:complete len:376 (-) Transcript_78628:762-1889(-)